MTERKPINPWLIFTLICIPIFIGSVDLTAIVVVLPQATLDLLGAAGVNKADQALWAVTAYLLAYTISLTLLGRFSDSLSRKRVFLACVLIFVVGSLWASFAGNFPLTVLKTLPIWPDRTVLPLISLIIARVIQAIGAGGSVSVGMALVSDIFPADRRAGPISLIAAIDSLGWVVGNLYSGLILQVLPSWQWLFLIKAILAAIALVLVWFALRRTRSVPAGGGFDLRGATIFAAALIALTLTIESLKDPTLATYLLAGISLTLFILFGWLQTRTRNALFDMKFIRQPEVSLALFTNLIVGFALILMVAGVPLMINLRTVFLRGEGLLSGALRAGVMLSALTLPLIVAAVVGEQRYRKVGQAIPVAVGLTLAALGFVGASFWTYTVPSFAIALPLALVGAGLGLTIGPLSLVVVDAAEPSARGLASSLVLMMRLLGMTFGTPLAASLTLALANNWATERVVDMGVFHDIARAMLVPPLATEALARVMLLGVLACSATLAIFYVPRMLRVFRGGIKPRSVLMGLTAVLVMIALVEAVATADTLASPTIPPDPAAQQLPANVTFYAALNLQQAFLDHTEHPLNAITALIMAANAPTNSTPASAAATTTTSAPVAVAPYANPLDAFITTLFGVKQWNATSYEAFCHNQEAQDQWQTCFSNGLLSWTGPQAAVALLPGSGNRQDYVVMLQATNRNNAIGFLTDLATALGMDGLTQVKPGLNTLTLNAGTPDERQLAVTQAYVLLGSPGGVQGALNHGDNTLGNDPDFLLVNSRLPRAGFAKIFARSDNFDADAKPVLDNLFHSASLNTMVETATRAISILTSFSSTPPLIGLSVRLDQQQLGADMVSSLRGDISAYTTAAVSADVLDLVPSRSKLWAAVQLDFPGLLHKVSLAALLTQFVPSNAGTLGQTLVDSLGQSVQDVLIHARGGVVVTELPIDTIPRPTADTPPAQRQIALILPMAEQDDDQVLAALSALKAKFTTLSALGGLIKVDTQPPDSSAGETVTISGPTLKSTLPSGFQYAFTNDHILVLTTGTNVAALLDALHKASGQHVAAQEFATTLPGSLDRFFYGYLDPSTESTRMAAALSGEVQQDTVYLHLVLRTFVP